MKFPYSMLSDLQIRQNGRVFVCRQGGRVLSIRLGEWTTCFTACLISVVPTGLVFLFVVFFGRGLHRLPMGCRPYGTKSVVTIVWSAGVPLHSTACLISIVPMGLCVTAEPRWKLF